MLAAALSWPVLAQVGCGPYFDRTPPDNVVYALVFATDLDAQAARQLENAVTPALDDLARALFSKRTQEKRPRVRLFVCNGTVGAGDLDQQEVTTFSRARAVALFWRVTETSKAGLMQIPIPIFLKSDMRGARRDEVELTASIPGVPGDALQTWMRAFGTESRVYRASVYMGLAEHLRREGRTEMAWLALCDSQSTLRAAAAELIRPAPSEVENHLNRHLVDLIAEIRRAMPAASRDSLPSCLAAPLPR